MTDSQTRQNLRLILSEKLQKLELGTNPEKQLSLFNRLFELIKLKKEDTDTTSSAMQVRLISVLGDEKFQISPENLQTALKELEGSEITGGGLEANVSKPKITISSIKTVSETGPRQHGNNLQKHEPLPKVQQAPATKPITEMFTPDLEKIYGTVLKNVTVEDRPVSYSDTSQYIVVNAIGLMARKASNSFNPTYDLESTDVFFCFKDPNVAQQYQDRIANYEATLSQLKEKADKTQIKSELEPLLEEIKAVNQEILNTYAAAEIAAYSGYKIIRKNGLGRQTNQSGEAKDIEIVTKQLNEKDALRIRLRSGGFLEIHLDENGNYDPTRPPVPLTAAGAGQTKLFTELDADPRLVDNNFGRTLGDLKFLNNLTINGESVLLQIIESIDEKHAQQIISKEHSTAEADSQSESSYLESDLDDKPNSRGQKPREELVSRFTQRGSQENTAQQIADTINQM